jgi:LuxR family maltose regulon positive regulatory protein
VARCAIRHALAAKDFERAADLVEMAVPAMRKSRQEATLLGWLKALPAELLRFRPVLSVHYAGALLLGGQFEGVEARLRDAERWMEPMADISERPEASSAEMVVVDNEEFRHLPGQRYYVSQSLRPHSSIQCLVGWEFFQPLV